MSGMRRSGAKAEAHLSRPWLSPHTALVPRRSKIAFTDETLTLFVIDVATGELVMVDRAEVEPMDIGLEDKPISDHHWSPDSRWLAYSKIGLDHVSNVYLYSLDTGATHNVSNGLFNDFGPVFMPDGQHLLFVSNRRFNPTYCDFEWEMVYKDVAGIYALTLLADGEALLPPLSDEVEAADAEIDEWRGKPKEEEKVEVRVDLDGIAARIEALPVPASNYRDLAPGDDASTSSTVTMVTSIVSSTAGCRRAPSKNSTWRIARRPPSRSGSTSSSSPPTESTWCGDAATRWASSNPTAGHAGCAP